MEGLIFIWLAWSFVNGFIAENTKLTWAGGFFISLLASPVLGLILALISEKVTPKEPVASKEPYVMTFDISKVFEALSQLKHLEDTGAIEPERAQALRKMLIDQITANE